MYIMFVVLMEKGKINNILEQRLYSSFTRTSYLQTIEPFYRTFESIYTTTLKFFRSLRGVVVKLPPPPLKARGRGFNPGLLGQTADNDIF